MDELKEVTIYTDGGCLGNPGSGGYGVVLRHGNHEKCLSGGFRLTTNNRMEIMAAIVGLEALKAPCAVTLHTDSKYVVDAMTQGWVLRWKAKNWWRTKDEKAINVDLWERLLKICERHQVKFIWLKGHAGHPENERCDQLAKEAASQPDLPIDEVYEQLKDVQKIDLKMTTEGQPCRKCATPVIKKTPRQRRTSHHQYYEYYLYCPKCQTMYMLEEAKRNIEDSALQI